MRIGFAGTPEFAATALTALIASGHDVVLVMSQPDRPSGRGLHVQATPVKAVATEHGIDVIQPRGLRLAGRFDDDACEAHRRVSAASLDVLVVAAYGLMLPASILALPTNGCINVHASLLPRWRGAAPIQRAIEAGDVETGVTIMQMDEGLDTGPVLLTRPLAIAKDDTAATLGGRLSTLGAEAIVDALAGLAACELVARPQHELGNESAVTYASKLTKAEASLDFTLDAKTLVDRIRAFDPWPGSAADLVAAAVEDPVDASHRTTSFKVWKAEVVSPAIAAARPGSVVGFRPADAGSRSGAILVATGRGTMAITELQRPGGKRLPARFFAKEFSEGSAIRFALHDK